MSIKIKRNKIRRSREVEKKFTSSLQQSTSSNNTTNRDIILTDGSLGIGTSTPEHRLQLVGSTNVEAETKVGSSFSQIFSTTSGSGLAMFDNAGNYDVRISTYGDSFFNGNGNVGIGTLTPVVGFDAHTRGRFIVANDTPMIFDRTGNDGVILSIRQNGSQEGTISVNGSTVSYNGFSGTHESSGVAIETPKGTVLSTIDKLDFKFKDGEIQDREDHPQVEISNKVADKRVYGVVQSFTDEGKVIVTSTGIGSILVTGSCQAGDLLESNGDGTARRQSDEVIRSSTIAKVTISNSDEGVKLVSCIMLQ